MILGSVRISAKSVETHRDTYLLGQLSVISVRRPFLAGGLIFALGGAAFGSRFADLLYPQELGGIALGVALAVLVGVKVGQIQLLSRDLRGSELSGMVWGTYGHLNRIRSEIVTAMNREAAL